MAGQGLGCLVLMPCALEACVQTPLPVYPSVPTAVVHSLASNKPTLYHSYFLGRCICPPVATWLRQC